MRPDALPVVTQGDARALPLPDGSVDLIVTSPPYWGQRSYRDGGQHYDGQLGDEPSPFAFLDELLAATREMARVLAPTGSIFVNLGDKYASQGGHTASGSKPSARFNATGKRTEHQRAGLDRRGVGASRVPAGFREKSLMLLPHRYAIRCADELGLLVRQDQVWAKPNGWPESVTDRTRRSHEYFFHLVTSPKYYADTAALKRYVAERGEPDRLPGSMWSVQTQPLRIPAEIGVEHYAAMPSEWPRRLITGWCPPGGTVLDPFGGTGTTALVAVMLGRRGISVDLSADYCRAARWRVQDPRERAKAMGSLLRPRAVATEDPRMELPLDEDGVAS